MSSQFPQAFKSPQLSIYSRSSGSRHARTKIPRYLRDGAGLIGLGCGLAEQFALGMDNQILNGTGSSAPTGILNTSGINSVAVSGALANYDKFSDGVGEIRKDNFYNPLSMVIHPRDVAALDKLKDTTNQPLVPPQSYAGLNVLQSSQLATNGGSGSDESNIIIGDFSELLLGMRTELRLEISREAKDAFEKGQVAIRAYMRFGVSIPRPTAFCKLTGVQG